MPPMHIEFPVTSYLGDFTVSVSWCNAQLQAKLRYAKAVPYSWGALAFLAFLIAGGRWRFILAIVFYPSMLILSLLFAQLSPLDVKPYDLNIVSGNPHK